MKDMMDLALNGLKNFWSLDLPGFFKPFVEYHYRSPFVERFVVIAAFGVLCARWACDFARTLPHKPCGGAEPVGDALETPAR